LFLENIRWYVFRVARLDALGDPGLRKVLLYVRAAPEGVTADDVAGGLGLARSVARSRLERLLDAGLLVSSFERRSGRSGPGAGRPAKAYAAAAESDAIEFPPRRYEALAALLLARLPRRGRAKDLLGVGIAFAAELADAARLRRGTMRTAPARVCRGLGELGFHAAVESSSSTGAVIVSATCPLRPLVSSEPKARAIDEGMWRGLLEAATHDRSGGVRCATHGCLDAGGLCRVEISYVKGA
jgi:predicted ArsR family transcriptional regulator